MHQPVLFSAEELAVLNDTHFLLTKQAVVHKLANSFHDLLTQYMQCINAGNYLLPNEAGSKQGKVSKGENYKGLPYVMLDFPRCFTPSGTFAVRTLCWWGHYFSISLQLQGKFLDQHRSTLASHWSKGDFAGMYFCTEPTPWHHDLSTGHILADDIPFESAFSHPFFKITQSVPLSASSNLEEAFIPVFTKFMKMVAKP